MKPNIFKNQAEASKMLITPVVTEAEKLCFSLRAHEEPLGRQESDAYFVLNSFHPEEENKKKTKIDFRGRSLNFIKFQTPKSQ